MEWILGFLVLLRSARLVHAVADCDSLEVGAGPGGCCREEPFGFVLEVPRHCRFRVGMVEPRGHPCIGRWW